MSNHGGRTLDTVLPTATLLPAVAVPSARVPAAAGRGIRRGWTCSKALALGARAVLIDRPYAWALAHHWRAWRGACAAPAARPELRIAMALVGVRTLDFGLQRVTYGFFHPPLSRTSNGPTELCRGAGPPHRAASVSFAGSHPASAGRALPIDHRPQCAARR